MENVTLSAAVRNNLLSLQNTATRLGKTQQRLATGLKVNSALDDPTAFFTASSLNSRASDLNRLLDSVGNAIETIRAADDGLSSITKLVQAAQATARQALQKPTTKLDNPITITGKGGQIGADKQINITGNGASLSSDRKAILQGNSDIAELVATGGTITINGTDIDIAAEATSSSVLAAINEKRETTGVSASLSVSNKLLLTGKAGKDIAYSTDATTATELGLQASNEISINSIGLLTSNQMPTSIPEGSLIINGTDIAIGKSTSLGDVADAINAQSSVTNITASITNSNDLLLEHNTPNTEIIVKTTATLASALKLNITGENNIGNLTGTSDLSRLPATGGTLELNGQSITIASGADSTSILTAINEKTSLTGVTASIEADINKLVLTAEDGNSITYQTDATTAVELGLQEETEVSASANGQLKSAPVPLNMPAGVLTLNDTSIAITENSSLRNVADAINAQSGVTDITASIVNSDGASDLLLRHKDAQGKISIKTTEGIANALKFNAKGKAERVNLLSQGAVESGQTLTVKVGDNETQTIVFGKEEGKISSLNDLESAIGSLEGLLIGTVDSTNGNISLSVEGSEEAIFLGGTANLKKFGLTEGKFEAENTKIGSIAQGETLTIKVGNNEMKTITFGSEDGEVSNRKELETALKEKITNASASLDEDGNLTITASKKLDEIAIGGTTDLSTFGVSAGVTSPERNTTRAALEKQYNLLRGQIDELARDSSFNGNNLLYNDSLTVIFNENGSSSLSIEGVMFDSDGLGIDEVPNNLFQSDKGINEVLNSLDTAIGTLRQQSSTFGANLSVVEVRQDFTKNLINTLETGAANLILADSNKEGANLLALKTRQELSSLALSLASQADQNVLRLFG